MEKITVKKLIEFRKKTDRTKLTFVNNLNKEKKESDGGGDYWISCLSAIRNTFKLNDADLLDEKINLLLEKIKVTEKTSVKDQFKKNIEILNIFKDYDFQHLRPNSNLIFLTQPKNHSILNIKGFPIEAKPCHIFHFQTEKVTK